MRPRNNIFLDLGFDDEEATVEAWRSDFARIIRQAWKTSGISQSEIARQLGTDQATLNRVVNGKTGSLSVEKLLRLCVRLRTRGSAAWGPSAEDARVEATEADVGYATVFGAIEIGAGHSSASTSSSSAVHADT